MKTIENKSSPDIKDLKINNLSKSSPSLTVALGRTMNNVIH